MRGRKHYACIYVQEAPVQAIVRQRPEMDGRAVVVMDGEAPAQIVCSLNAEAQDIGVTHGMTSVELESFDDLEMLVRSSQDECCLKHDLLECASSFSPRIEDRSQGTAFACIVDIAGTERLFGKPEALTRALWEQLNTIQIQASVVSSQNIDAGLFVAKSLPPDVGWRVVRDGEEAGELSGLRIDVLDLPADYAETLHAWGIRTLGMLAELPEQELVSRLGQYGARLRKMARGEWESLFQPLKDQIRLEEKRQLDVPVEDMESLLFCIAIAIDELIARVSEQYAALASISVHLELGSRTHSVAVQPALPTNDRHLWLKLIRHRLEATPPATGVVGFLLVAESGATSKVQRGIFSPQLPEAGRLDVMLARIARVVGECNVGRAVLEDSHAPDAFRVEPFRIDAENNAKQISRRSYVCVRQLRPRVKARVYQRYGRPARLYFREREYSVESAYGPWNESGGWWSASPWGAELWDIVARAQEGTMLCCCLVRDLLSNEWKVTALYD